MAIKNLTTETFEATVEQGIVLVDLWATWCGRAGRSRPGSKRQPNVILPSCSRR